MRVSEFHFQYARSCENVQGEPISEYLPGKSIVVFGVRRHGWESSISSQVLGICRVMWPGARLGKVLAYLMCKAVYPVYLVHCTLCVYPVYPVYCVLYFSLQ